MITAKHYMRVVIGVYADNEQAQSALRELQHAGIAPGDISLVGSEEHVRQAQQGYYYPALQMLRAKEHEAEVFGAGIGAAAGLLSSTFEFLLPGLGLVFALVPLAGMLIGAGIGAITSGPLGALSYQDDASEYRTLLQHGYLLVIVHCATTEGKQKAHAELNKTHPRQLNIVHYPV